MEPKDKITLAHFGRSKLALGGLMTLIVLLFSFWEPIKQAWDWLALTAGGKLIELQLGEHWLLAVVVLLLTSLITVSGLYYSVKSIVAQIPDVLKDYFHNGGGERIGEIVALKNAEQSLQNQAYTGDQIEHALAGVKDDVHELKGVVADIQAKQGEMKGALQELQAKQDRLDQGQIKLQEAVLQLNDLEDRMEVVEAKGKKRRRVPRKNAR